MGVMKKYRQVPVAVELVGDRNARVRTSWHTEGCGLQRPPLKQPQTRCGRSAAMVKRRTWVNIAVCPCLHSSLTHDRNIENKEWEIYFCKEVCSFLHWSSSLSLIMFPLMLIFDYVLYFDLRPSPKCHSRWCTGRKWHIPKAVRRGNLVGGNWLTKWDKLKKSHDTLIDWRTGREWPLNCMTVISAWWRFNMRFQRSSGRSSGRWTII